MRTEVTTFKDYSNILRQQFDIPKDGQAIDGEYLVSLRRRVEQSLVKRIAEKDEKIFELLAELFTPFVTQFRQYGKLVDVYFTLQDGLNPPNLYLCADIVPTNVKDKVTIYTDDKFNENARVIQESRDEQDETTKTV